MPFTLRYIQYVQYFTMQKHKAITTVSLVIRLPMPQYSLWFMLNAWLCAHYKFTYYYKQVSTQHIPEIHITNNFILECHVLINHDIVNAWWLHTTKIILNSVVSNYLIQMQYCKYYFAKFHYCVPIKLLE